MVEEKAPPSSSDSPGTEDVKNQFKTRSAHSTLNKTGSATSPPLGLSRSALHPAPIISGPSSHRPLLLTKDSTPTSARNSHLPLVPPSEAGHRRSRSSPMTFTGDPMQILGAPKMVDPCV